MKHADAEIPETQPTILTNTAKPIVLLIASPWVERYGRHPRVVTLTSGDEDRFCDIPNGDEIILPACEDVLAIRRPADADQATIV